MSDLDQFADLELSKEDQEQIFEPPTDRQQEQYNRWYTQLLNFYLSDFHCLVSLKCHAVKLIEFLNAYIRNYAPVGYPISLKDFIFEILQKRKKEEKNWKDVDFFEDLLSHIALDEFPCWHQTPYFVVLIRWVEEEEWA